MEMCISAKKFSLVWEKQQKKIPPVEVLNKKIFPQWKIIAENEIFPKLKTSMKILPQLKSSLKIFPTCRKNDFLVKNCMKIKLSNKFFGRFVFFFCLVPYV